MKCPFALFLFVTSLGNPRGLHVSEISKVVGESNQKFAHVFFDLDVVSLGCPTELSKGSGTYDSISLNHSGQIAATMMSLRP